MSVRPKLYLYLPGPSDTLLLRPWTFALVVVVACGLGMLLGSVVFPR